uniref:Uncharacterized protein n=2 Tax=gambiae species complex TaxID=44542 RepID=A0A8W7Q1L4_ANOCL
MELPTVPVATASVLMTVAESVFVPNGCSPISSSLIPPSFLPAGVRLIVGRVWPGVVGGERNPPVGTRDGIPFSGVVSVILRGMPRDRKGTVGADIFLRQLCASEDFCSSSARKAALFGLRFSVKCFTGVVCWPTTDTSADLLRYWHSSGSMPRSAFFTTNRRSSFTMSVKMGRVSS